MRSSAATRSPCFRRGNGDRGGAAGENTRSEAAGKDTASAPVDSAQNANDSKKSGTSACSNGNGEEESSCTSTILLKPAFDVCKEKFRLLIKETIKARIETLARSFSEKCVEDCDHEIDGIQVSRGEFKGHVEKSLTAICAAESVEAVEHEKLKGDLNDSNDKNKALVAENESLKEEREKLKGDLNDSNDKNETLVAKNESLKEEREFLKGDLNDSNDKNETLVANNESLIEEREKLKNMINELKRECATKEAEITEMSAAMKENEDRKNKGIQPIEDDCHELLKQAILDMKFYHVHPCADHSSLLRRANKAIKGKSQDEALTFPKSKTACTITGYAGTICWAHVLGKCRHVNQCNCDNDHISGKDLTEKAVQWLLKHIIPVMKHLAKERTKHLDQNKHKSASAGNQR